MSEHSGVIKVNGGGSGGSYTGLSGIISEVVTTVGAVIEHGLSFISRSHALAIDLVLSPEISIDDKPNSLLICCNSEILHFQES
ncbi:hypothetical protein Tco_0682497 [Tanacetum coccineum]|uniref:Uncharacterized protein n=1 Tax=Tanacetum coccineum TaxID=301880 RepID=A0ABQ4XSZ4_9ASTR